jgi:hypothetical protein
MITARRAVISVILAAAAALMVFGFTQVRPTNSPVIFKNSAVVAVSPGVGTSALRQSGVSVTLAAGYGLAYADTEGMSISANHSAAVGIPQDELQIFPGQNQYTYAPGPGRTFSELPSGNVCVSLLIIRSANLTEPGQPFSWCFVTQ